MASRDPVTALDVQAVVPVSPNIKMRGHPASTERIRITQAKT
jgi:hypothetical protein